MLDQFVYIRDDEYHWIPGLLLDQTADEATVTHALYETESEISGYTNHDFRTVKRTVKLRDYPNNELPLQNTIDGRAKQVEDMIELSFLHEAAILYNIKNRHVESHPYTRTGDIIIAVNPYQWFPNLYKEENRLKYSRSLVWEARKKNYDPRNDLPPHVYETSALAYKGLSESGIHQSILVSGESGAGKTETVKICMNHLASVVQKEHEQDNDSSQDQTVIKKILDSNPLLEAFGNAKTRRNDNSSRFGKYVRLQFQRGTHNNTHLTMLGSECQVYLLEKSRVVRHERAERTFHIFYQLLAAPDIIKQQFWHKLEGSNLESFVYVGETDTTHIEGVSDEDQFQHTIQSLAVIGVKDEILKTFMQAICAVLQLGNLQFGPHPKDSDHSVITSTQALQDLAELMGIPVKKLETTLTQRLFKLRREETYVPLSQETAKDSVDALAKQIYNRIFLWLVKYINKATSAVQTGQRQQFGIIGLLDIFGFESFQVNSFEQLCINYANEQLQQKFTKNVFVSVFEEYKEEGISLDEIHYDDNTHVLDLIEGRVGLLKMLNEECIRPNGSDYVFVNKALHANKTSPALIIPKIVRSNVEFGIRHYAGNVIYDATGFVSKNNDSLAPDLMEAACSSTNSIIAQELGDTMAASSSSTSSRRMSNLVSPTMWSKYKSQLKFLMLDLEKSEARYIRCVKPNSMKAPRMMEHGLTLEQLRSSGVISAVTLARSAFPNRLEHTLILERFFMLWPEDEQGRGCINDKIDCDKLLTFVLKPLVQETTKAFVIGNTRAYFRAGALEYLEAARLKGVEKPAIIIQAVIRGFLARQLARELMEKKRLKQLKHWNGQAVLIQLAWRRYAATVLLRQLRRKARLRAKQNRAAVKIQSMARTLVARKEREKRFVQLVKEQNKKLKRKKKQRKMKRSAVKIQKIWRGAITRIKHRFLLEKVKRRAEIQAQIEEMKLKVAKQRKRSRKQLQRAKKELDQERRARSLGDSMMEARAQTEVDEMIGYLEEQQQCLFKQIKESEKKIKSMKDEFEILMADNSEGLAEYKKINKKNKKMKETNDALTERKKEAELKNHKLENEIQNMSVRFLPIANSRYDFKKSLENILKVIDKKCKDDRLREAVMLIGIDCHGRIAQIVDTDDTIASPTLVKRKKGFSSRNLGGSYSSIQLPTTPTSDPGELQKKKVVKRQTMMSSLIALAEEDWKDLS